MIKTMKRLRAGLFALLFMASLGVQFLQGAPIDAVPTEIQYDGTNTHLSGDDGGTGTAVPIGFNFTFYQQVFDSTYVNINGTLNFENEYGDYSNTTLPNSEPGKSIMAFWDDIITYDFERESILYHTEGSAPNRKFIVQWTNMYFYSDPTLPMGTFQVILYEGSNKVQVQYRDLLGGSHARGDSATIGINKDGEVADQVSYETDFLTQGQAISYTPGDGDAYDIDTNATYDPLYLSEAGAPGIPVLTAPSDGATSTSRTPTFTWDAASLADTYRILISDNPGFSNAIMNRQGLTATSFSDISFLDANTTYYWKVEAVNAVTSAFSVTWSFTTGDGTGTAPDGPLLVSPEFEENNLPVRPTFTWQAAALATSYRIYISAHEDFSLMEVDQAGITGLSYTPSVNLQKDLTYFWKVEAYNADDSTFSDFGVFYTQENQSPDDPAELSPTSLLSGKEVTPAQLGNTAFTFGLSDPNEGDLVQFDVEVATDSDFENIVIGFVSDLQAQGPASYRVGHTTGGSYYEGNSSTSLTADQDYYIRFMALDGDEYESDWAGPTEAAFTLVDALTDNVSSSITTDVEDNAPNGGDANDDGTPDSYQTTVTSFVNPVTNHYASLATEGCDSNSNVSIAAESQNTLQDDVFTYPAGLLNFTLHCGSAGATATITQYYYNVDPADMVLRKYNPDTQTYTNVDGAVITAVTIGGEQATKVVYDITDGEELDQDGVANGVIIDPSGLAAVLAASTPVTGANAGVPATGLAAGSLLTPAVSVLSGAAIILSLRRRNIKK
jgi:hypothetical protein